MAVPAPISITGRLRDDSQPFWRSACTEVRFSTQTQSPNMRTGWEEKFIRRLKERMAGAPFALLAVNYAEGNPRVEAFLQKVPVDFAILMDRDSAVSKRWQARALPYTVVLDPALRIRYTVTGELDWSAPDVEAALRKLLPPQ